MIIKSTHENIENVKNVCFYKTVLNKAKRNIWITNKAVNPYLNPFLENCHVLQVNI